MLVFCFLFFPVDDNKDGAAENLASKKTTDLPCHLDDCPCDSFSPDIYDQLICSICRQGRGAHHRKDDIIIDTTHRSVMDSTLDQLVAILTAPETTGLQLPSEPISRSAFVANLHTNEPLLLITISNRDNTLRALGFLDKDLQQVEAVNNKSSEHLLIN